MNDGRSGGGSANPGKPAVDELASSLYDALHGLALKALAKEQDATVRPTELVHECYLQLARLEEFRSMERADFIALSSTMIRHILVDQARRRRTTKRGHGWKRVTMSEISELTDEPALDLLALDDALLRLSAQDERQSRIVELRFFGGLSGDEIAGLLNVSRRTITKEWGMARAWLRRELAAQG